MAKFEEGQHDSSSGIVEWTPPNMNWNPWINQPMIIEGAEEYQVELTLTTSRLCSNSARSPQATKT